MSWKKNGFGYLIWAVYALMTGGMLAAMGSAVCVYFGITPYYGLAAAAMYGMLAGGLVFLIHKLAKRYAEVRTEGKKQHPAAEAGLVVLVLAGGLALRFAGLASVQEKSAYYDLAQVVLEQNIPQITHGAVYLYIRLLNAFFRILGNRFMVGIGLQIILQAAAALALYAAVRRLAGKLAALALLFFNMLSPFMVEKALTLSPEMLYLFLFSLMLLFLSEGTPKPMHWARCLLAGAFGAALFYLDAAGSLSLVILFGALASRREWKRGARIKCVLAGIAGFTAGAAGCVLADAFFSGKEALGVWNAWMRMYSLEEPRLSVTITNPGTVWVSVILLCFMAWGIFSFWCGGAYERFGLWSLCLCLTAFAQCMGIFTQEMEGYLYLFFFGAILAGISVQECFAALKRGPEGMTGESAGSAEETEMEGIEFVELEASGGPDEEAEPTEPGNPGNADAGNAEAEDEEIEFMELEASGRPDEEAEPTEPGDSGNADAGNAEAEDEEIEFMELGSPVRAGVKSRKTKTKKVGGGKMENKKAENSQETAREDIQFIENPLPLPKRHKKRVMDYALKSGDGRDDFDVAVTEDDDFDI